MNSTTDTSSTENNPYNAPNAELLNSNSSSEIHNFTRFSAWAVFFLSLFTAGIYPVYWLYSRSTTLNETHESKIHKAWLISLVAITLLSFASSFFGDSEMAIVLALLVSVAYLVIYITVLFMVRNRLQTVIQNSSNNSLSVGPVLTFFFNCIYLQYKINECIDQNPK